MRTIRDEDATSNGVSLGQARAVGETPKALAVQLADGEERWIPKSQLHDDSEVFSCDDDESEGELVVKRWWAEKEGLA